MNFLYCLTLLSFSAICSGQSGLKPTTTDQIKALRNDLFVTRGYDKYARPIPAKDQLRILINYSLISIRDLDIRSQTMTVDGWLWYQWHDEGLKWESKAEWANIKALRVPSEQIYTPDIKVYNDVDHTTKKMVNTNAILYPNGLVIWVPPITSKATCNINLKKWPYDEHICFLKFGSWTHDGNIMDVKTLNDSTRKTVLSDFIQTPEFDVKFLNATDITTFYPCCEEPYPCVIFYFKLQRKPTLYHYIVSMPALVAIISSLITFWFPIRSKIRFVLNGISLLTLTLLLIYLGTTLGFSTLGVPIAVRFLSLTTLFIGITQIWFTIGYNISTIKCPIPLWTLKMTKPLVQMYKNSENEDIHLTQTEQTPDVSKKVLTPTAEDLTMIIDKIVFVIFAIGLGINSVV